MSNPTGGFPSDQPVEEDWTLFDAVADHWSPYLGEVKNVFHVEQSKVVHIDLLLFEPDEEVEFWTLVSAGMAQKPMNVPAQVSDPENYQYAELFMHLPKDWPIDTDGDLSIQDERFWPVFQMLNFAGLPHLTNSWVWGGHTMTDNPPKPLAPNTQFCAAALFPAYTVPEEAEVLQLHDGREIVFLQVAFLYPEELDFTRKHGQAALMEQFERAKLSPEDVFMLNPKRRNAITGR